MTWNYFKGPVIYEGVEYFQKTTEFDRCRDLPSQTRAKIELAVAGDKYDPAAVRDAGWTFVRGLP